MNGSYEGKGGSKGRPSGIARKTARRCASLGRKKERKKVSIGGPACGGLQTNTALGRGSENGGKFQVASGQVNDQD